MYSEHPFLSFYYMYIVYLSYSLSCITDFSINNDGHVIYQNHCLIGQCNPGTLDWIRTLWKECFQESTFYNLHAIQIHDEIVRSIYGDGNIFPVFSKL